MAMILTYPTWQDQSRSFPLNFPVNLFSRLKIGDPKVSFYNNVADTSFTIKVETRHDGRHFEVVEKHFYVSAEKDREYFIREVHRLLDRLVHIIEEDEIERWINLTP